MKSFFQQPEDGIEEEWLWQTDVHVADDGSEQRIMLCPLPKRTVSQTLVFDRADDMSFTMTALIATGEPLLQPFWQSMVRINALSNTGSDELHFNAARTDLRPGQAALLVDRAGNRSTVTIEAVTADGCSIVDPVAAPVRPGALLVPLWPVYAADGGSLSRKPKDNGGSMTLKFADIGFMSPFVDEFGEVDLDEYDGLPVVGLNSIGSEFQHAVENGAEWTDYGGVVEGRNRRKHAQIVFPRDFKCNRVFDLNSWKFWKSFADYCKGSLNPFFIPTFRQDFPMFAAPAPNGNTMTFKGVDYADDWFPHAPFKRVAIFSALGVHYASVTAVNKVAGNTVVTFAPALPNVAGWANEQKVSLLLKARISDDKVSLKHYGLNTIVTLNLRTVDA